MTVAGMDAIVREHPFFAGLGEDVIALVAGCTRNVVFEKDAFFFREGEPADEFFLVRHGSASLETVVPGRGAVMFQTVPQGGVVGLSWLIPPYRWAYDARALEQVRAIGIDATCLRRKCDTDPAFGYAMMMRFVPVLVDRLQAARLQALDLYGRAR